METFASTCGHQKMSVLEISFFLCKIHLVPNFCRCLSSAFIIAVIVATDKGFYILFYFVNVISLASTPKASRFSHNILMSSIIQEQLVTTLEHQNFELNQIQNISVRNKSFERKTLGLNRLITRKI